ncbi:alpha/beta-hydrolase [Schizopora paradoxa]|uniref:Alpha/beta-hydrolase n=1 Tax=Schizopora paradoxa TaxID=27342 RepID=A0A0H2RU53_9AGAM|nr:alpha/beta-hydrolase [Schizopora paradoxa]
MSRFETIKNDLQDAHVKQLKYFSSGVEQMLDTGDAVPVASKQDIMHWIDGQEKKGCLKKAKANRMTTPEDQTTPDYNNAIFAIIGSAAMYLRRDSEMQKAIIASKEDDNVAARRHINESQTDIVEVAERLGLKFVQLCDLADVSGKKAYAGAFCGAFVSEDDEFVGVAFKGSSSWNDWREDSMINLYEARAPILYGSKVHSGFYFGLFDTFNEDGDSVQPFAMIMDGLKHFDEKYYLHVTGHSLGGAYSTFLHCELNRLAGDLQSTNATINDILTFGSPRTGVKDFADKYGENMQPHQNSWRFANKLDLVPKLPVGKGYTHVDTGYKLYKDRQPELIHSERTNEESAEAGDPGEDYGLKLPWHKIEDYYNYISRVA